MIDSYAGARGVCLVIPCFNEARRLRAESFREFSLLHESACFVFVDDGSQDATLQVLEELCRDLQGRGTVLPLNHNRGKAEAVRAGVNYALEKLAPEIVGFWDADLATPLAAVDNFLQVFEHNSPVLMVFGARVKLLGRRVERRALRHYLGRVFATAVSTMLRLPIYDSQCGAKLFRADEAARAAFIEPFISKWVFDVEILARYLNYFSGDTNKLAEAVYEYPLEEWVDVAGSKVRGRDFLKASLDLLRIQRRYL
jgi:dolichyl-phosphate beta-glucosyltransferase